MNESHEITILLFVPMCMLLYCNFLSELNTSNLQEFRNNVKKMPKEHCPLLQSKDTYAYNALKLMTLNTSFQKNYRNNAAIEMNTLKTSIQYMPLVAVQYKL